MSWVTAAQGGSRPLSVPTNLDEITDEEFLRQSWQQAEDFSDRRRIRARMYKLREERLREMVQNDEENLGALTCQAAEEDDYDRSETDKRLETERKSSIEVKMIIKEDSAITDSVTMQNVSRGGITMRGIGGGRKVTSSDEEIIEEQIKEISKGRGTRYQQIKNNYDKKGGDSVSKTSYSIQSNALTADSYQSMKHKEVRDSVSPTRGAFDRSRMSGEDSETFFTSDDEIIMKSESAVISRKVSGDECPRIPQSKSDTIVKKDSPKKITERKMSKDLTFNLNKRPEKSSPTSPTRRFTPDTKPAKKQTPSPREAQTSPTRNDAGKKSPSVTGTRIPNAKKTKLDQIAKQMDTSLKNEYKLLDAYINESIDKNDEIIMEEEEEACDEDGNIVKMIVQTRRNKDGTECTTRRVARSTKVVDRESEIDEILIGNPDHEVLDRNVEEKEEDDGSKIKIITETRRRPDGIEYTTKNVLKTSKIFDYDHPEDISYCDQDELISSEEFQETDEHGITIRTVTETRRKQDGTEYITKKVFKTSKVDVNITPSDDDEIFDSKETEEKQNDGTIIKTIIERRRTRDGHEYTHRQIYRSRKVTLSSIDYDKGMPQIDNDDEIIDKKEKQELDQNKSKVKVVTETRRRKDGTTYSFDYVLRSFKGTEKDIKNMPIKTGSSSNISVSENDKLLKEDIKEEIQKDGSTVKTITERRRAKDGTEYLRHRIMRIPKLPEPELQVGSLDDEVLEEDFKEKVLEDGTHCRAITERRRSSVTGAQYTLRRMSKVYQHHAQVVEGDDEIIDENVTEEETSTGIVIKTVIRRYERPDGTFYTTHDIQKSYRNPVSVSIEVNEDDELVDRSYDERETNDGYIIKTIVETRTRTDGTHYTVERTEKVSKLADNVQVSFRGNSIIVGSPGDKIISSEEHEEPSVNGTVMKTIVEVRQRADGTQYTNKTTIKSTQLLVPEHETSYVVIKADTRNGKEDLGFFPSLDDEIVYTRKKNEVDERGNAITIVIETRKNNKSGELYNLTKKVHTTDVVMTTEGEKIFTNKRPVSKKPTNEEETDVPFGSVSALKSRFVPVNKKDTVKSGKVAIDRTNTANKKMFFEEAAAKTLSAKTSTPRPSTLERNQPKAPAPSYDRKNKDKSDDSSPETTETSRSSSPVKSKEPEESPISKPLKNSLHVKKFTSPESSDTDSPRIKSTIPEKKPVLISPRKDKPSRITDKPSSPKSDTRTKKDISPKRDRPQTTSVKSTEMTKIKGRSSDSSPELKSPGSKSPTKQPVRSLKSRNESPIKSPSESKHTRVNQSPVSSSPRRGRSPLRSGTSSPREGTPSGRQCCKQTSESGDSTPSRVKSSPVLRKRPSDDKIIINGEKRAPTKPTKEFSTVADDLSRPKRITQERSTKKTTNELVRKSASPRIERPSTISKTLEKRVSPLKTVDKRPEKKVEAKAPFLKVDSKDPIISMPQTPLTEEMKTYPSSTTPFIEDVSMEPDLPYQSVHRPSLVREPSEHLSTDKYGFEEYEADQKSKVDKETKSYKPFEPKLNDKPKSEKFSDTSEDDSKKPTYFRYSSPTKRENPIEDDSRKPFDTTKKSPEKYDPSRMSREFSKKTPRDTKLNGYHKTESEDELTDVTKNKFSERVTKIGDAAESLVDQIIPDVVEKKFATCKYSPEAEPKVRPASIRQSLFQKSTKMPDSSAPSSYKKEPLIPVVEPLVEKRYVHPLGSDDESDTESRPKVERDVSKLTSTRLVMDAMSDTKQTHIEKDVQYKKEEIDVVTPLRDRSMSPLSSYSRPRSKEGSPSPFMKEDSPSRFATGRPIDEGANISKIKRLERSHSNKKIIYEDLEAESSKLPGYLVDIEYITDITVLETLLQKAESYEERRVIRGHIRNLKKTDTNFRTLSSSPAPYKRFVDTTTPSRPSPTSSPLVTRRTPVTTTSSTKKPVPSYSQSKDVSETTRKSYTRGNNETDRKSSFEETSTRKLSTEETWTSRKSSREETVRKSSREETVLKSYREETSRVTSLDTSRRIPKENSMPTRKPSDEGPRLVRRVSKEDTKPGRKSSIDEESKPKKKSSFEFSPKPRRSSTDEDTKPKRKSSTDDDLKPKRKPSTDDDFKPKRKPSTDDDFKPKRKPSTDDDLKSKRKSSNDEKLKPLRKTSTEVDHKPKRQSSTEDESIPKRKTSQNETLVSKRKTPEKDVKIKRMPSTEEDSKISRKRFDENRKTSTEETNKYTRKISGDDKKYIKRQTSGESPSGRKISGEEPKPTRRSYAFDDEPTKSSVSDVKSSYSRSTAASKKVESVVETNKYTRKTSTEKTPSHVKESSLVETGKRDLFQKEKSEPKTPSRFGREVAKDQPSTYTSRFNRGKPTTTLDDKKKQKFTPEESFVEPLRHQRNQNRAPIQQQTDMEKIVSPYGVGPTDENGLPLFGLRALKKRTQPTAPSEKTPEDFFRPKEEAKEFVPSDSQGKPLFGIKAVRKSPPEKTTFTATQVAKETATMNEAFHTATAITEESHFTQSLVSQPQTFETEVVTATNLVSESYPSTNSSSDDSQDALRNLAERRQRRFKRKVGKRYNRPINSDEEEENLKNINKSNCGHLSSDEGHSSELDDCSLSDLPSQGETSPALVKAVHESLRRRHTSSSDSEVEEEKSKNLKDIIKLHESKVADIVKPDSSPKLKPKKVIRDSFEPTNESPEPRTHRTWDLEADFSTRSEAVGNIIAKHETLTKQEKKLTGILKKTSTSSMTTSKLTSSEQDTDDDEALNRRNKSKYTEDDKKFERKTSYTEIKLSSPTSNVSGDVTKSVKKPRDKKSSPGPISTSPIVEQKDTYLDTQVTLKSTSSKATKTKADEKFITIKSTKTQTGHDTEITFTPKKKQSSKIKVTVERTDEPSKELEEIEEPKYVTKKYIQIDKKKRQESPARKKVNEDDKEKPQRQSPILSRKPITSLEKNRLTSETTKKNHQDDIKTSHSSHKESCEFIKRKNLFDKMATSPTTKRQPSPCRKFYTDYTGDEKPKQIDTPITQKQLKSQPITVSVAKTITTPSPKRVSSPTRQDVTKIMTPSTLCAPTVKNPKEVEILKSTALIRKQDRIHKARAEVDNATNKSPHQYDKKFKTLQSQFPDFIEIQRKDVIKKPYHVEISIKKQPKAQEPSHKITSKGKTTLGKSEYKVDISTQEMKETRQTLSRNQEVSDEEQYFRNIKKKDLEILKKPYKKVLKLEKQVPAYSTVKVEPEEFTDKEKRKSDKEDKKRHDTLVKQVDNSVIYRKPSKSDNSKPEDRTSLEVESVSSFKAKSNFTSDKTESIRKTDKLNKKQPTDVIDEKKTDIDMDLKEKIPEKRQPENKISEMKVPKQPFDSRNPKVSDTKPDSTTDETKAVEKTFKQTNKSSFENEDKKEAKRPDTKIPEPDEKQPHYNTCKRKPGLPSEVRDSKSDESYPEEERSEKMTSKVEGKQLPDSYKVKQSPKEFNKEILKLDYETKLEDEIETKTTRDETKITKFLKKQSIQPLKETEQKLPDTKTEQVPDVTLKSKSLESRDLPESGPEDKKTKKRRSELIRKCPGDSLGDQKPKLSSDETENVRDGIKPEARTYKVDDKKKHELVQQKIVATDERTQLLNMEEINNLKNVFINEEVKSKKAKDQFKSVELETGQAFDSSLKLKIQSVKPEKMIQDSKKTSKEESLEQIDKVKPEKKEQDRKKTCKEESFKPLDKVKPEKKEQDLKKTSKVESFEPMGKVESKLTDNVRAKETDDIKITKTKYKVVDSSFTERELILEKGEQEITHEESIVNRRTDKVSKETVDKRVPERESIGKSSKRDFHRGSKLESEFQTSDKHKIVKKDLEKQFPQPFDTATEAKSEFKDIQDDSVSLPKKKDSKVIRKSDKKTAETYSEHSSESESTKHTEVTTKKAGHKLYEQRSREEKMEETKEKDSVSEIHTRTKTDTEEVKTEKIGTSDVDMEVNSIERLSVDAELKLIPTVRKDEADKVFERRKAFKKVFTKEQVDSLLNMESTLPRKDTINVDIIKYSEEDSRVKPTKQLFGSTDNLKSKEPSDEAERLSVKSESNVITSRKTHSQFTETKSDSNSMEGTQLGNELSKKTPKRQPFSHTKVTDSTPKSKRKTPSNKIIDTSPQIGSLKKADKDKLNSLEKQTTADEIKRKSKTSTVEQSEPTIKVESKFKTDFKKIETVKEKNVPHDFTKKSISKVDEEEYTTSDSRKDSIKKTHKVEYHRRTDEKRKIEVHSDKKIYQKEPKVDMSFKEFPRNKTPKNSPESRFSSKSPEPDDITRRLKKLSRNRDSSEENITNVLQKKSTDARTSSLQSLSASSTTSSVPGYMRPRGDSRKHSTPERDPQEVEDLLLRSYEYTRCTKRVNKNPVSYDYAYSINTKEGAAGGGSNYSIYFGPRRSVPATEQPKEVEILRRNISNKKVSVPDSDISVIDYAKASPDKSEPVYESDLSNKYDFSHSQRTKPENDDELYLLEELPGRNTVTREETSLKNVDDFEYQQDNSHYLVTKSVSDRDDRKESIKSIASIEQQYEDTLKALDTASDLKPEDKSYLNIKKEYLDKVRSSSTMKASSETKEHEVFSDSRLQYQDTVRNVSKDVLRKPSVQFREDIEYDDANDAVEGMNVVKKISLGDNLHPNIIITEKNDSSDKDLTSHYITESNLEKTSDSFKKTARDFDREGDESRKNLLSVDMTTQISKSSDLQEKYKYQVEKNTSKYVKVPDSCYSSRKQNVESSSSKDYQSEYKTHETAVNKYLPDYDYNKVYASKIIKSKKDSTSAIDQSSSHVEHFQTDDQQRYDTEYSSKFVAPETYSYRTRTIPTQDTQTYVTFDGRTVTRKSQQTHDNSSPSNQKSSTVGYVDHSMHSASPHRDDECRPQVETSPCATVGQEKSATFVRGTSRDESVNMSSQGNAIAEGESRSFLDDQSKVTGISDILSRMGASEAVDHEAKVTSDEQARSLLNKFIGAQVLMTGVESMMANSSQPSSQMSMMNNAGNVTVTRELSGQSASRSLKDGNVTENRSKFSTGPQTISYGTSSASPKVEEVLIVKGVNINEVTDDFELNQLLDSCEEYEERRRVRLRLKALMAEKKALQKELGGHEKSDFYSSSKRTAGVTGSKELRSSEGGSSSSSISFSRGSTQVTNQKTNFSSSFSTSQNTSLRTTSDPKGASAFDKFKQLDAGQPRHSTSAKSGPALSGPLFQLSSSLKSSANSIKDIMLTWCQCRTRDYQGVKIENFSTSWNDGLAFCALIHHFYPDSFDFNSLNPNNRRHNFTLAFRVADEKAGIYPLLDVDDMVMMQKPDWKSVFTYVQSLYKRLKDE